MLTYLGNPLSGDPSVFHGILNRELEGSLEIDDTEGSTAEIRPNPISVHVMSIRNIGKKNENQNTFYFIAGDILL